MDEERRATIKDKQAKLNELLRKLAADPSLLGNPKAKSDTYQKLEEIYCTDGERKFRHFYSDFFPLIVEINENPELGSVEDLINNLKYLSEHYQIMNKDQNGNFRDAEDEIIKLYDHINLDVARLNHFTRTLSKTESSLNELKTSSDEVKEGIRKAINAERNYITILGIFASIVLAFTGGLAFSTSVLENMSAVSPYRLAFIVEALGFVFINVVYILVWFIQKIHKVDDIKYPCFMKVLNLLIIGAILATLICWYADVVNIVEIKNQLKLSQLK